MFASKLYVFFHFPDGQHILGAGKPRQFQAAAPPRPGGVRRGLPDRLGVRPLLV